jgi:hypothetical protein
MNYSRARSAVLDKRTEKLLVASLKKDAATHEEALLGLIKEGADLEILARTSRERGVSSLVYRALRFYVPADKTEERSFQSLRISHTASSAVNEYYKDELVRVLEHFAAFGIAAIPLKGITLANRLYGDITSRDRSVDVDLLVREKDKDRAGAALKELGYVRAPADEIGSYEWCRTFHKPRARMIELHWDITMMVRSTERIEGLWEGAEEVKWEGASFYDFKPEELLLYLSAHLVNSDSFRKLKYLCDIDRLIGKYGNDIDWAVLSEKAVKWRLRGSLYAALKITGSIFNVNFPKDIFSKLRLSLPKRIFITAFANKRVMLRSRFRRRLLDSFLSYILFEISEAASFKDYTNIFKRVCWPPKEIMGKRGYLERLCSGAMRYLTSMLDI